MAAKHGASSMLNATKAHMAPACMMPEASVNMEANPPHMDREFSVASPRPNRTPNVETRFSLATRALMEAAADIQLSAPSGTKIQEMASAMALSRDCSNVASRPGSQSPHP